MGAWIQRQIEPRLRRLAATRPVVVLTGARQTGKTALCRHLFPDHHYVSLDLPSEAATAEQDPALFLARHPLPLLIDEVQYAPGLFRHLKVVVDQERQRNGAIVLTGSQPFALMQNVSESLAGRAAVVNLHGLSLAEILGAAPQSTLPHILLRGSFPELWSRPAIEAGDFHRSTVSTYLERDLRSLQQVGNLQQFERFLRASALRSGQLLNRAELARDVGIAASTAGLWLSVLERSGLVFLLEPWFGNAGKRLSRSPKLYWRDTGLGRDHHRYRQALAGLWRITPAKPRRVCRSSRGAHHASINAERASLSWSRLRVVSARRNRHCATRHPSWSWVPGVNDIGGRLSHRGRTASC